MICLVTGGAGFIGSHLCDYLISQSHNVICIDNLITGKKQNINHLTKNPNFQFELCDVLQFGSFNKKVDYIFHLASPASPRWYQKYPVETTLVNTYGTYLLLELAKRNCCPLLFASTSEVYGDPKVHPQPEEYWGHVNPNGPRSCYDEAKRCGESLIMTYVRHYGVDGRIVRIFNTYGPRMDIQDGRVVSNFIYQALSGKKLTLQGSGKQTRSFCYVEDMVKGIVQAAFAKDLNGEVINLGNPEEVTIMSLAMLIAKKCGQNLQVEYKPLPTDDPVRRKPVITRAKQKIHWQPQISLDVGLEKTIAYFQKELNQ